MNNCTLHLLLCTLIASQTAYTTDIKIEGERHEPNEIINSDTKAVSNPFPLEKDFKTNESHKIKDIVINPTPLPSKSTSAAHLINKGYAFNKQYGPLIGKISEFMWYGRSSMNFFGILRVLPYIMLALQKVNEPPPKTVQDSSTSLKNFNLASVLENPGDLVKLFSDANRGNLANDAIKVLAGQDASETIENLMKEVKANASDMKNGQAGIDGEHLVRTLLESDNMKHLFPTEERATKAASFINAYMDYMSNLENKSTKGTERGFQTINGEKIRGTLLDSVTAFFKTGRKIMNQQLQRINSDADKNLAEWKQSSSDGTNDGTIKNKVINKTPDAILKIIATANVLKNQYSPLFPYVSQYFLPIGAAMDALKFICLVSYVILKAKKENMIPEIEKDKLPSLPGLNVEQIVNTLNNKETMAKLFPQDQSSKSTVMLKFLAGRESIIVDEFVEEIKKTKSEMNPEQTKITIYDLVTNAVFVKKILLIINSVDAKLKSSLGLDLNGLRYEIIDEMKKYNVNDEKADSYYNTVSNILSATSAVGMRKSKINFQNFSESLKKDVDKMKMKSSSSETEYTMTKLFRLATSVTPKPALYGVAAMNKVMQLITSRLPDKTVPNTKNDEANVIPSVESNASKSVEI